MVKPKDSPIEPFGLSVTLFVIALGGVLLWSFVRWEQHREATGKDPLVHLALTKIPSLRAGLYGLFSQNLILMGVFFVIPLYLQLVLGLDALETGIKMLPVSITMFISAALGSRLSKRFPIRTIVRAGLWTTFGAALVLIATIDPQLKETGFAVSMGLLGVGMGLMASQLGNVVQSSVDASGRGEAGGLQYTGQQLGSSLGVALIGAIVLAGLTGSFISHIQNDERINQQVATQVSTAAGTGVDFVASTEIEQAAQRRRTEQVGNRRHRRRLRESTTRGTQGRPARCRAPRARLARLHRRPAPRAAKARRARAPTRPDVTLSLRRRPTNWHSHNAGARRRRATHSAVVRRPARKRTHEVPCSSRARSARSALSSTPCSRNSRTHSTACIPVDRRRVRPSASGSDQSTTSHSHSGGI